MNVAERSPASLDTEHVTFCRLCEAFCGMTVSVRDGKVIKIGPDRDNPHSQGHICVKGPAIADIANDPDRVLQPLKSWMHNPEKLARSQSPMLLINPFDASTRGIASGDTVDVRTASGAVKVSASVTEDVERGSVCYPHGWGHNGGWRYANTLPGANINRLLGSGPEAVEKVSGTTFIDGIAVRMTRATAPAGQNLAEELPAPPV